MFVVGELFADDASFLHNILKRNPDDHIIQLGNMRHGVNASNIEFFNNHIEKRFDNFRFIRGNNDNPEICRKSQHYLGNYGVNYRYGYFFVSGSGTTEQQRMERRYNVSWFMDEEMQMDEMFKMASLYEQTKPEIVITNEIPHIIKMKNEIRSTKTSMILGDLVRLHKPRVWIYCLDHPHDEEKHYEIEGTIYHGVKTREVMGL